MRTAPFSLPASDDGGGRRRGAAEARARRARGLGVPREVPRGRREVGRREVPQHAAAGRRVPRRAAAARAFRNLCNHLVFSRVFEMRY